MSIASPDMIPMREYLRHETTPRFPVYRPTVPQDPRRGRHRVREAMEKLPAAEREQAAQEDAELLEAEA